MDKVEVQNPKIVRIAYCQEKADPILGYRVRAYYDFDLEKYRINIRSNCGDATFRWARTRGALPFLQIMARIDKKYLISKLFGRDSCDVDATIKTVRERIISCIQHIDERADYFEDFDDIKAESEKEEYAKALDHLGELENKLTYCVDNEKDIEGSFEEWLDTWVPDSWFDLFRKVPVLFIQQLPIPDYSKKRKIIVQIFEDYIQPKIKEILRGEDYGQEEAAPEHRPGGSGAQGQR